MKTLCIIMLMLTGLAVCAAPAIWMVGDSTMSSYSENKAPLTGWGQVLNEFCKPDVKVVNKAASGRSSKSFIDEKRFSAFSKQMKEDDFLIIQFGHNDQKKNLPKIYTLPETTYPEHLMIYINVAREKGVTPVLVTSLTRRFFKDGKLTNSLKNYPDAMRKLAKEQKIDLIDMTQISRNKVQEMGEEESMKLYNHLKPGNSPNWPKGNTDNTHFNRKGAEAVAGWFVEDAKKQKLPIAELFK